MFQRLLNKFVSIVHNKSWWKFIVHLVADIRFYKGGIILFGDSSYQIKGPLMREILNVVQPGDVFLRRYNHFFGTYLIPGYWSHAAIYVGDNIMMQMLGQGINKEDILTFMRADEIKILRPKDETKIQSAIEKTYSYYQKGEQYDYGFMPGDKELYCSELVYTVYGKPEQVKYGDYILPDDLDCDFFEPIWTNKK